MLTTLDEWLKLAWQFESCVAVCFMQFLSMTISLTQIFHKVVYQYVYDVPLLLWSLMTFYWQICQWKDF